MVASFFYTCKSLQTKHRNGRTLAIGMLHSLFPFLRQTPQANANFSALEVDIHSHLLPGIDDGAPDLPTSLELIQALMALGYRQLYTTPHVMTELYPNTRSIILRKRDEVQEALQELGIDIGFDAAAEYYIDEAFVQLMKTEPLLTLPGNRVLVEQSMMEPFPELMKVLFDLQMRGYQPVLAHPERYAYYRTVDDLAVFADRSVELQVNLLSLNGYYGAAPRKMAKMLVDQKMLSFLGTDLHHNRHADKLQALLPEALLAKGISLAKNGGNHIAFPFTLFVANDLNAVVAVTLVALVGAW